MGDFRVGFVCVVGLGLLFLLRVGYYEMGFWLLSSRTRRVLIQSAFIFKGGEELFRKKHVAERMLSMIKLLDRRGRRSQVRIIQHYWYRLKQLSLGLKSIHILLKIKMCFKSM
ncbi:hypothetical protein V6Z12_D05G438400 [Gossypium hirsutum]